VPRVENFDVYNNFYIWQHVISVGILSELHSQEHLDEIFLCIWCSYEGYMYIICSLKSNSEMELYELQLEHWNMKIYGGVVVEIRAFWAFVLLVDLTQSSLLLGIHSWVSTFLIMCENVFLTQFHLTRTEIGIGTHDALKFCCNSWFIIQILRYILHYLHDIEDVSRFGFIPVF
jgi:hypothetical protein